MKGTYVAELSAAVGFSQRCSVEMESVIWFLFFKNCHYEDLDLYLREIVLELKKPLHIENWISKEEQSEQMNGTVYVM